MLRVARFTAAVVLLVLVSGAGCDEDPPRPRDRSSTSVTPTPSSAEPTATETSASGSATPTDSPTERVSLIATRTGYTITRDGSPIDAAGLSAIGWTVNADIGEAAWSDPSLGGETVTWELPDQRAIGFFDVSFWGSVTGANLAINPSMSSTIFKSTPREATAHSTGAKVDTPTQVLKVTLPEMPVGTAASVSINLGFPQPVLVTYHYVYE